MNNQELDILKQASAWLHDGHQVLLATVVNSWGSSPRPPGSLMAMREDGHVSGSVSGGCIEDDLIGRVLGQGLPKLPELVTYGEDAEEMRRFGLPCGGTLRLVLEPCSGKNDFDELLNELSQGKIITRQLNLQTGESQLRDAHENEILKLNQESLSSVYGPRYRLLIIGAGQVSSLLAEIAISLDFAVTICDPREEYYEEWKLKNTVLTTEMPDDAVAEMSVDKRTAIVALTHDPKLDDLALMEGLKSPAFYVAALGSKLNNENRRKRLKLFDLSSEQIADLKGPAGLSIGSKTPAEIAVSIAAELISIKNGLHSIA